MANDKDVNIRIGTEADTSGAEKAKKAIDEVSRSAATNPMTDGSQLRATQQQTEALEEQSEQIEEVADATEDAAEHIEEIGDKSEEAAPKVDKVMGLQRAQLAQQFGEALGRGAQFARQLADELAAADIKGSRAIANVATGLEAVSGAVQGAAAGFAAGGPLGAAVGATVGLLTGPLRNAITGTMNDLRALKVSQDNAKQAQDNFNAALQRATLERRRNSLMEWFQQGREAIDAATAALRRHQELLSATAAADTAERENRQAAAGRAGASPYSVRNSDIQGDAADSLQSIRQSVEAAQKAAEIASSAAASAANNLAQAKADDAATAADVQDAQAKADEARKAADEAQKEAEQASKVADQKVRELVARTNTALDESLSDASDQIGQNVTDQAEKAIEVIEGISKEKGEQMGKEARDILERLYQIVRDNIPDESQAGELASLMAQFRTTTEGQNAEIRGLLTSLMDGFRENSTYVQQLRQEIEQIRSWMKTQQSPR